MDEEQAGAAASVGWRIACKVRSAGGRVSSRDQLQEASCTWQSERAASAKAFTRYGLHSASYSCCTSVSSMTASHPRRDTAKGLSDSERDG
jgi:hypothetical protein